MQVSPAKIFRFGWVLSPCEFGTATPNTAVDIDALLLAVLFPAGVGLFFGSYQANRAASLNPIDALRYE